MNRNYYNAVVNEHIQRGFRKPFALQNLAEIYAKEKTDLRERMTDRFCRVCAAEEPKIIDGQQIVLLRTVKDVPDIFTAEEREQLAKDYFIHETGYISNYTQDYGRVIASGLLAARESADEYQKRVIDAILDLCRRYRETAVAMGRNDIAETLERVPAYGARTLREAFQAFRVLHYALWLEGDYHNTIGRFDLMMQPYYDADMAAGRLDKDSALELIEDFFLSFNIDSDMYFGQQQGDNGQSLMLGGLTADGTNCFSELSELCLVASRELKVIDPKINIRVDNNTPDRIYELGTSLTAVGLGFPQYTNDDIALPGLAKLGYDYEDAVNYSVAACWELIVPGNSRDIVNVGLVNLSKAVNQAIVAHVADAADFDELLKYTKESIKEACDAEISKVSRPLFTMPSPFIELLSNPIKYRNYGFHGCGAASAADSLAAVKKFVYDEKTVTPERLIKALAENYANDPELYHLLRYEAPKTGNDDDTVDAYLCDILATFAEALEDKRTPDGFRFRAGTGTAMGYVREAAKTEATADGRHAGEPFGANYSPNLFAKIKGPVSVVRSFAKPQLVNNINGGPLTLEFAAPAFKNDEACNKVAGLVKHFIQCGGHQLQLNAVNLEEMKAAQEHPDEHTHLIVRIWGWSAYFVELDKCYQDHVMLRQEYTV